jgi:hypothetical protein
VGQCPPAAKPARPRLGPDTGPAIHHPRQTTGRHACIPARSRGVDRSASARDWGWVCGPLETGLNPAVVYQRVLAHAGRAADTMPSATPAIRSRAPSDIPPRAYDLLRLSPLGGSVVHNASSSRIPVQGLGFLRIGLLPSIFLQTGPSITVFALTCESAQP